MRTQRYQPVQNEPYSYTVKYESPLSRPGTPAPDSSKNAVGYGLQSGTQPAAQPTRPEWQDSSNPNYNSIQNQLQRFKEMSRQQQPNAQPQVLPANPNQPTPTAQSLQMPNAPLNQPDNIQQLYGQQPASKIRNDWVDRRSQPQKAMSPQDMLRSIYQNQAVTQMPPAPQPQQLSSLDYRSRRQGEWGVNNPQAGSYADPKMSW